MAEYCIRSLRQKRFCIFIGSASCAQQLALVLHLKTKALQLSLSAAAAAPFLRVKPALRLTPLQEKSIVVTSCHSMPPKRPKETKAATPSKKAKTGTSDSVSLVESLISDELLGQTYCEELGINLSSGSNAVFQWLACSSLFGSRLSEVR